MRIKILFIVGLLAFGGKCFAQTFSGLGFKAGLVAAFHSVTGSEILFSTDSRLGFTADLFGEFFKYKFISFVPEINFEQKGGNERFNDTGDHYLTLNLISIPLSAKITFPSKIIRPYFSAGPRIDIYVSHSNDERADKYYGSINPVNFGIITSAGIEIVVSKKISVIIEASYSPDFTRYDPRGYIFVHDVTIRNTSFEFRTGLKFNH